MLAQQRGRAAELGSHKARGGLQDSPQNRVYAVNKPVAGVCSYELSKLWEGCRCLLPPW